MNAGVDLSRLGLSNGFKVWDLSGLRVAEELSIDQDGKKRWKVVLVGVVHGMFQLCAKARWSFDPVESCQNHRGMLEGMERRDAKGVSEWVRRDVMVGAEALEQLFVDMEKG